jgi:Ser/Thr protein kinase RdoA (MazF antagonist)
MPPEIPASVRDDLEARLASERNQRVRGRSALAGGSNNRLFRLDTTEGAPLLAKLCHSDRWNRLDREFATLACLERQSVAAVPRPLLRSDDLGYAVYSFEPGAVRPAADLGKGDLVDVAAFAARLHAIAPGSDDCDLPDAIGACFSPADQLRLVESRLQGFETFSSGPDAYDEVRAFVRDVNLREALGEVVARATVGLSEEALRQELPRSQRRLSSADFGPHNLLFDGDRLTVVDWEWGGWDDPARMVMGFVAHASSEGLSSDAAGAFLAAYVRGRGLDAAEIARFERAGLLLDAEWVATYATALTDEAVAPRRLAVPDFDLHEHLMAVIARLRARLKRAVDGPGYRVPADS